MEIIIQPSGKGIRLKALTRDKPKCLVPINNLPIIFDLFQKFQRTGITIEEDSDGFLYPIIN